MSVWFCELDFHCPKQWGELTETADPLVRDCSQCGKPVHFIDSQAELEAAAEKGQCVAFFDHAKDDLPEEFRFALHRMARFNFKSGSMMLGLPRRPHSDKLRSFIDSLDESEEESTKPKFERHIARTSPNSRFDSPQDVISAIQTDGFNWLLVRKYFQFTDDWLSEGEYDQVLGLALATIDSKGGQKTLLDMLDLQYAVLLEQIALQDEMLEKSGSNPDEISAGFGERVMAYLQINSGYRRQYGAPDSNARNSLLEIPPGKLIDRLLGETLPARGSS